MPNNFANLDYLLEKNDRFINEFEKNQLMILIKSHQMDNPKKRKLLLDCLQVFSNYFQKTVMLRNVFTETVSFLRVSQEHLAEEFGHDILLMNDRKNDLPKWDAILDSCSCWFSWKMLTSDNIDKTLLVHLVLEASAHLFFKEAHKVMSQFGETNYFKIHSELDEKHEMMGVSLLTGLREEDYKHLLIVQEQGWDVLNAVCQRIAELTLESEIGANFSHALPCTITGKISTPAELN